VTKLQRITGTGGIVLPGDLGMEIASRVAISQGCQIDQLDEVIGKIGENQFPRIPNHRVQAVDVRG
jgi:hypothetical protein